MKLTALLHSKLFLGIAALVVTVTAVVTGFILKNRSDEYRVVKVFEVIGKAIISHTVGGLCAGMAAHWIFLLISHVL